MKHINENHAKKTNKIIQFGITVALNIKQLHDKLMVDQGNMINLKSDYIVSCFVTTYILINVVKIHLS